MALMMPTGAGSALATVSRGVTGQVAAVSRQAFNDWRKKRAGGPTDAEADEETLIAEVRKVPCLMPLTASSE